MSEYILKLHSVDFEENTISLTLPDNFWDNKRFSSGNVKVDINCDSQAIWIDGQERNWEGEQ